MSFIDAIRRAFTPSARAEPAKRAVPAQSLEVRERAAEVLINAKLPMAAHANFKQLTQILAHSPQWANLRAIILAQWALESGWGSSQLAKQHLNYAGAKWRPLMAGYGTRIEYSAHDGSVPYIHFNSQPDFIRGYWARFDLITAYSGWRNHTSTPEDFISFIGPIWVGTTEQGKAQYIKDVLRIYNNVTCPLFNELALLALDTD